MPNITAEEGLGDEESRLPPNLIQPGREFPTEGAPRAASSSLEQ